MIIKKWRLNGKVGGSGHAFYRMATLFHFVSSGSTTILDKGQKSLSIRCNVSSSMGKHGNLTGTDE